MKILQSETELEGLFSSAEKTAYLGEAWNQVAPEQMLIAEVNMGFESPARGRLNIRGGHKQHARHFVIKFTTELERSSAVDALDHVDPADPLDPVAGHVNNDLIKRQLTLVGDAHTGVITAMLPGDDWEGDNSSIPQLDWTAIKECLEVLGTNKVWQLQKDGFKAFSAGEVSMPPVIYMQFDGHPNISGDLHLKGAHKKAGEIYVFKIATGFPGNSDRGLLPTQGLMIAFDARTGAPLVILKDEGHLTDLRTAICGRNAAEELMPDADLTGIGMLGTGVQARLQLAQLESLYPHCRKLTVWGRTPANCDRYASEMTDNGWDVTVVATPKEVADRSNLIITTTPSEVALLDAHDITNNNTLIIAIGADMPGKIELSPALLKKADCVLIDSIVQGKDHGNAAGAIRDGVISENDLQEFGDFLNNHAGAADMKNKLRVFLSSGIGVQDLQIVQAVIAGSQLVRSRDSLSKS